MECALLMPFIDRFFFNLKKKEKERKKIKLAFETEATCCRRKSDEVQKKINVIGSF